MTEQTDDTQQQTDGPWFGDLGENAELSGWAANKGWETPADALTSHYNLEKLIGADKAGRTVVLPKDENDADGMASFRKALGVPDDPSGYELPVLEGQSEKFAEVASTWFHKAGVPKEAAQAIGNEWNEFLSAQIKEAFENDKITSEKALTDLKTEWGDSFNERSEFARRGMAAYGKEAGLDEQDITALEQSIGTSKMLKLFHKIGETTAESGFVEGETSKFGMTPAEAQGKLDEARMKRANGELTDSQWQALQDKYGPIASKAA